MPTATATEIGRVQRAGRNLDRALMAVAAGALAFSTVNVAILAIDHGIPPWIAWLLEPLIGVALWAVLSSDAVLSRYGMSAGAWAWCLRAFTGLLTLTLNIWSSVFTTRTSGRLELTPDPAGILLHAIAPVLLILLAEAAPRYRVQFAAIAARLHEATNRSDTPPPPAPPPPPRRPEHSPHDTTRAHAHREHAAFTGGEGEEPEEEGAEPREREKSESDSSGVSLSDRNTWFAASQSPDSEATLPSSSPLSAIGSEPDSDPGERHRSKKRRRQQRRDRNDARARAILRTEPRITGAQLARRLGVQPRSGQRILNRVHTTREGDER